MSVLHEEIVVIKVSKLLKDGSHQEILLSPEVKEALAVMMEQLLAEAAPGTLMVEIQDLSDC